MTTAVHRLRGITWEHPRGLGSMVAAATAYRDRTGIEVVWDHRSLQEFADAPLGQLTAGYDLLVIDHPHVPGAAAAGDLAPLDGTGFDAELSVLEQQSVGPSHASYSHGGHQYGLASDAAAQVAAYRPDLLTDPPRDWDGVLELAREGRVLWPAKPIDAFSSLVTVAGNQGAVLCPQPGVFLAEDDAGRALDLLHRLAELVPAANLSQNPIEVAELLSVEDQWCYAPLLFGYTNYSRSGFRAHRLHYVDIPSAGRGPRGSLLGGAGVAVSAHGRHQDEARAFAVWVASAEVQRGVYFDGGGQPGNSAAWDDDRLNAETDNFFRGTRATLEQAYVRPRSTHYIDFQDTVSALVNAALTREITDRQFLTAMAAAAEELLGDVVDANV